MNIFSVAIWGFRPCVNKICALMGLYVTSNGNCVPIGYPETSVRSYSSMLRKIPEKGRCHIWVCWKWQIWWPHELVYVRTSYARWWGYSTHVYNGAGKSLARPRRKQARATEDFWCLYILFIIIIGGILVLYIYIYIYIYIYTSITRLASNEMF
jgi:hypothetical protein